MSKEKRAKHDKPKEKKVKAKKPKFRERFKNFSKQKKAAIISAISAGATIALALLVLGGYLLHTYFDLKSAYNKQTEEITDQEILEIQPINEEIINIALFGIDSRSQNYSGNSDSIMILSVNTKTGDIKLISVMRDSLVNMVMQDNGKTPNPNKINSAYARGGASYAIKVLNKNFGLDIKRSITVNFFGMAEIIDAVGGIEINVLKREIDGKNRLNYNIKEQASKLGIKNPPLVEKEGKQLLTGIQAVAWARIRAVSTDQGTANDYGRTDRQRVVMEQLLNKVLSMDMSFGEFKNFAKKLLGYMKIHNMDFEEAVSIAFKVLSKKGQFEQTRVPQTKYVINDDFRPKYAGSCVYYDLNYASKLIHAMIYDGIPQDEYMKQNGVEKNKWYTGAMMGSGSSNKGDEEDDTPTTDTPTTDTPTTDTPTTDTPETNTPEQGDGTGDENTPTVPDDTNPDTPDQNTPGGDENQTGGDGAETTPPGGEETPAA